MLEIKTKMLIKASAHEIFEAFVDPEKIGNFWFSSSSERWTDGADVTLTFKEFKAEVKVHIEKVSSDKKILLSWGPPTDLRAVTIQIDPEKAESLVTVSEVGFQEYEDLLSDGNLAPIRSFEYEEILKNLLGGKEGWTFVLTCLKAYLENGITTLRTGLIP